MSNYIKLNTSFKNWEWYNHKPKLIVFLHLLLTVKNDKTTRKGVLLNAGELFFTRKSLALETGLTNSQVRGSLNRLKKTKYIELKTRNRGSIVTVLDWSDYTNI